MSNALLNIVGWFIGVVIAASVDAVFFGVIAAIPLAALVVLGLLSQPTATAFVVLAALVGVLRVVVVSLLQA